MLAYQLTRPIAFRQIQHPTLHIINIYVPGALTIQTIILYSALPIKPKLFGDDSVTSNALLFITVLGRSGQHHPADLRDHLDLECRGYDHVDGAACRCPRS